MPLWDWRKRGSEVAKVQWETGSNWPQLTGFLKERQSGLLPNDCLNDLQLLFQFAAFLRVQNAAASNCTVAIKIWECVCSISDCSNKRFKLSIISGWFQNSGISHPLWCSKAVQGARYWDIPVKKLCNSVNYGLVLSLAWISFQFSRCRSGVCLVPSSWDSVTMETESEQNSSSTSGSSSSGGSARPQISQMSLYERQAVQVRCGHVLGWHVCHWKVVVSPCVFLWVVMSQGGSMLEGLSCFQI